MAECLEKIIRSGKKIKNYFPSYETSVKGGILGGIGAGIYATGMHEYLIQGMGYFASNFNNWVYDFLMSIDDASFMCCGMMIPAGVLFGLGALATRDITMEGDEDA